MPCVAHKRRSGVAFFIGGDKLRLQPITRKERFLYEIVGWGETAPEKPTTPEEFFFAAILGEAVQAPEPLTRYQMYLAKIAGREIEIPYPKVRLEYFLAKAAGMDVETPVPLTKEEIFWANYKGREQIIEGIPPLTFKSNGANLSNYRIYGNTVNGESVGDLVESGEHAGEYLVPVTISSNTTSIYLPYQIRKAGDEAEYIDYEEQKQHRVRKNLLQNTATSRILSTGITVTVNDNKSVVVNGTSSTGNPSGIILGGNVVLDKGAYILSGCPQGGSNSTYKLYCIFDDDGERKVLIDTGDGATIVLNGDNPKVVDNGFYIYALSCDNNVFFPMLRKADITDDTYEPYIENTDLDVTLPALPTLSGTNTLSVETTVQPSKVMIKTGKFGTHKVRYYDSDGTFLSAEDVKDGTNAQGFMPTKASTAQYNYTFMGWSTTKGSTTAETGVLNDITADKSLYAIFTAVSKGYTVYFYNGETLLETVTGVPSGGTATYTGTTPTSSQTGYIFDGWNPSNTNITADTNCYAQFVDEDMYESISDTWSEIIANVSNGTYSTKYHIGDTKRIDLGTEGEVIMTIVGIDTDDLADNSGKAPITWISKQLLKADHRMNPSYSSGTEGTGSLGGWEACEMRSYLINTIKPLLPSEVRNALKTVKKYSKIYNTSGKAVNNVVSNDDIWIPSVYEVNFTSHETSGVTYSTAFPDDASRIKHKVGGSKTYWWLRSAATVGNFMMINMGGVRGGTNADASLSVAVGFAI